MPESSETITASQLRQAENSLILGQNTR
jgi:hypothetical protein